MNFIIEKYKNVQLLNLSGSLLAEVQSKDILDSVSELIQQGEANIVVDLKELKFINSSGLGMMLTILTKARKSGGDVVLANVPEQVNNLLVITKLTHIFKTALSVDEAVSLMNA